jgi:carbon-monoxide dehydrogenase medium subunit
LKAAPFEYHAPSSTDEALGILRAVGGDARVLAGGQSLVPTMATRLARPAHIVDINRIARMERPTVAAGRLRIPPLMRHVDFEAPAVEGPLAALLAHLATRIAVLPVRLRGTFCGAVAHADPASAWCLAAVVLGAEMSARSADRGIRNIPAARFFTTILATDLADDEMLVEVQIPLLPPAARFGYDDVKRRRIDYPLATALAVVEDGDGVMRRVRLGVGGVEAVPRRLAEVEAILEGREPGARLFRAAGDAAADLVEPVEDAAADPLWRRDLARAVVVRALERTVAAR